MGNRPITVLVLYAALVTGLGALIAGLSAAMARQAVTILALEADPDPRISRVDKGLVVQARVTEWQPVSHVVEIRADEAPEQSAVTLASAMDAAENVELSEQPTPQQVVPGQVLSDKSPPTSKNRTAKPRVAGWIKRAPRQYHRKNDSTESVARLIERRLRAEM